MTLVCAGWLHEVQWVLCTAFWSMDMTGVYACLFEAVCDVTTVPSHLNNIFNFVHWLQFWWRQCFLAAAGLFCTLFAILWPFSFWKLRSVRHLFLLPFSFSFFLPWRPEYGINCGSKNSISVCWFDPLSPCRGHIKNAWKWKNRWMSNEFQLLP